MLPQHFLNETHRHTVLDIRETRDSLPRGRGIRHTAGKHLHCEGIGTHDLPVHQRDGGGATHRFDRELPEPTKGWGGGYYQMERETTMQQNPFRI